MKDVTAANFGLLIAYLLPGFLLLWGIGEFSPMIHSWLGASPEQSPTIGGFLYVTLGAVACGLFASTVRWAIIDRINHRTGISEPDWNFAILNEHLEAFELLVASHYRYYQFYANSFVAVALTFVAAEVRSNGGRPHFVRDLLVWLLIEVVLWLGARDTLRKYFRRAEALMEHESENVRPTVSEDLPRISPAREIVPDSRGRNGLKIEGPFR